MEGGTFGAGEVPLVRKVRMALGARAGGYEPMPWRRAAVRRDLAGLLARLEGLKRSFPEEPDLLERVGLSSHVIRLFQEARGEPVAAAGRG